jgi:uncharacterized protein YkwD
MKHICNIILLTALLSLMCGCEKENASPSLFDMEILEEVNKYRTGLGLVALESNEFLWELAQEHSSRMADGSIPFGIDGLSERSDLIRTTLGSGSIAENIAKGKGTAQEIVNNWLSSVGHKENMEGNFTHTGLSSVKGKDGNWYFTQIFYKSTN